MFRQVIGTLFTLMEQNEWYWKNIRRYGVETLAEMIFIEPEAIEVNLERIVEKFRFGAKQFGSLFREILSDDCVKEIESARKLLFGNSRFPFMPGS